MISENLGRCRSVALVIGSIFSADAYSTPTEGAPGLPRGALIASGGASLRSIHLLDERRPIAGFKKYSRAREMRDPEPNHNVLPQKWIRCLCSHESMKRQLNITAVQVTNTATVRNLL
jgi:hypothetical protein